MTIFEKFKDIRAKLKLNNLLVKGGNGYNHIENLDISCPQILNEISDN